MKEFVSLQLSSLSAPIFQDDSLSTLRTLPVVCSLVAQRHKDRTEAFTLQAKGAKNKSS
jgi:hypothetical protein